MVHLTLAGVSKHLTKSVINETYKLRTGSDDSIKSIELSRAAPAGEGLLSAVYRIHVSGTKFNTSFIVKGLITDPVLRKSIDCPTFFNREALFFSKVLPLLIDVQKSTGAKENIKTNIPICYGLHLDGNNDYILMEDLSESHCEPMSKNPTTQERNLTLKAFAHLHAVSLALQIKKPDEFSKIVRDLPEIYYNEKNRNWYTEYLQRAIKMDVDVIAEIEGTSSVYYKKFAEIVDGDVYGKLIKLASACGSYPVLNHGDAWCPNFLCSKDKVVLIDFQLFRCASPATDLAFFILLCCSMGGTKNDFLSAIDIYYTSLEYYLNDMGFDANQVFPREALNEELKTYGKFGILAAATTIPLLGSERCDVLQTTVEEKFAGLEKVPLVDLWPLSPMNTEERKMNLVNAVRVAVDVGLL